MSDWRIGRDVPWSVAWSTEQAFRLRPSRQFPGWVDLVQQERPGFGAPKFAEMNLSRQRRAMRDHLCHVCGGRTEPQDRHLFPGATGGFVTLGAAERRYASTVPAVHGACGQQALRLCPHLGRMAARPMAYPREPSLLRPTPEVPDGMAEVARSLPSHLPVVYSLVRIYGPRFSARVAEGA
ncbi:hypothetical protein [Acidisoma sp. 7E03]